MKSIDIIAAKSDGNDKTKWLSLKSHSMETAGIMGLLYNKWLPEATRQYVAKNLITSYDIEESKYIAGNFCQLIAMLHDIGKITPAFQSKISGNIDGYTDMLSSIGLKISRSHEVSESPHNIAGQVILEEMGFPKEISVIVGSHHGRVAQNCRDQLGTYGSNYFGWNNKQEKEWRGLWEKWVEFSLKETGWESIDELPKPNVKVQMILTGLLIMSDWIASNTKYFPYIDADSIISDEECQSRIECAWTRLGLPDNWYAEKIYDLPDFFRERFQFEPNPVQTAIMNAVNENPMEGIYILEASMGIGKTEAALAAAEILASKFGEGGIYFGLPTQATANGVFGRIRDWAEGCDTEDHTIRLAHGMTDLNEEYQELFRGTASDSGDEGVIVHEWFEGRKQALLADFVIATVDQFLLASLKQKHVMLRHLGLAGKVVIIDECHAYDAYMSVYLDRTLTWMGAYKVPVIILSATLPPKRRSELIKAYLNQKKDIFISDKADSFAYPVITWTSGNDVMQKAVDNDITEKHISVTEINESGLVDVLSEKLSDGGCAAVIVNTVGFAQKLSKTISDELSEFEVICFHSRFTAADRAVIEKRLLAAVGKKSSENDRNRLIVVGTQVIEQSLDVDLDFMVTELCPMDLLLQRSGRLHRHERTRPDRLKIAELAILHPDDNEKSKIYSEWILYRTEKYLPAELVIPGCIPYLVSKVYDEPENDEERSSKEWAEFERVISDKKTKAEKYCIKANMLKDSSENSLADFLKGAVENCSAAEASVRDSDETIEVLVMQKMSENRYCLPVGIDGITFDTTLALSDEEAKMIAMQRLKLPMDFSKFNYNKTGSELDVMPKNWRESKWLKGEMLLLLDENSEAELIGKKLRYTKKRGLEMITEQG